MSKRGKLIQEPVRISVDELSVGDGHSIGYGTDAEIEYLSGRNQVVKRFLGGNKHDRQVRAQREFDALAIAQDALAEFPGISVPQPVSIGESGELYMEYCDGLVLHLALSNLQPISSVHTTRLSEQLGDAIIALSCALPRDQLDFSIRNTIVQENPARIVLVDFTPRELPLEIPDDITGIEVGVASFLTSANTYQIRRSSLRDSEGGEVLRNLASKVVDRATTHSSIRISRVRRASWAFYWRQSRNRGWMRYLWFHSVGAVVFSVLLRRTIREGRGVRCSRGV